MDPENSRSSERRLKNVRGLLKFRKNNRKVGYADSSEVVTGATINIGPISTNKSGKQIVADMTYCEGCLGTTLLYLKLITHNTFSLSTEKSKQR